MDPDPPGEPTEYVGSPTCLACHPGFGDSRHGHAQAMKRVEGVAPSYPDVNATVGVPTPPEGFSWFDLDFVIGGYTKGARFVDSEGFLLTDGTAGTESQYNLPSDETGIAGGFAPHLPDQTEPLEFEYDCFRCHATGAMTLAESGGRQQGNRPGILGTWAEEGVACEACHGPGNLHLPNPSASNIVVDTSAEACAECHSTPGDPLTIAAHDGYIAGNQQYAEVQASPHRDFACTLCHDPHESAIHDPQIGIRNDCTACHADVTMALHEGKVFQWGSYTEELTCQSCHMPPAAKYLASNELAIEQGPVAPIGDTRSHIMWINTSTNDPSEMFTEDGSEVIRDADGNAEVAVCFVCYRCHHGEGNAFRLPADGGCAIGPGIHERE